MDKSLYCYAYVSYTAIYVCVLILVYVCPHTGIGAGQFEGGGMDMAARVPNLLALLVQSTLFTCFTGTKVQILTQKAVIGAACGLYR